MEGRKGAVPVVSHVRAIVAGLFQLRQSDWIARIDPSSIRPHGLTVAGVRMMIAPVVPMPIIRLVLVLLLVRLLVQLLILSTNSASVRRESGRRSRAGQGCGHQSVPFAWRRRRWAQGVLWRFSNCRFLFHCAGPVHSRPHAGRIHSGSVLELVWFSLYFDLSNFK